MSRSTANAPHTVQESASRTLRVLGSRRGSSTGHAYATRNARASRMRGTSERRSHFSTVTHASFAARTSPPRRRVVFTPRGRVLAGSLRGAGPSTLPGGTFRPEPEGRNGASADSENPPETPRDLTGLITLRRCLADCSIQSRRWIDERTCSSGGLVPHTRGQPAVLGRQAVVRTPRPQSLHPAKAARGAHRHTAHEPQARGD